MTAYHRRTELGCPRTVGSQAPHHRTTMHGTMCSAGSSDSETRPFETRGVRRACLGGVCLEVFTLHKIEPDKEKREAAVFAETGIRARPNQKGKYGHTLTAYLGQRRTQVADARFIIDFYEAEGCKTRTDVLKLQ